MDLDQIRNKLKQQANSPRQSLVDPRVDWPNTHIPRPTGRGGLSTNRSEEPTKLFATVETLQQRAASSPNTENSAAPMPIPAPNEFQEAALQEATIHLKRLTALADRINFLSSEQESLLGDIQEVQGRLQLLKPYLQNGSGSPITFPSIAMDGAVLASAETDQAANLVLTYRTATILQPEQEAREVADHLRGTYGFGSGSHPLAWSTLFSDFGVVWQEPADILSTIWHRIRRLKTQFTQPATTGRTGIRKPARSLIAAANSISIVDMLIWFGGGVIGRTALNLVLSALPFLWSFAVAGLTAVTAYALYRATLAPRRDFGFAFRVFLVIAGLVIGGQF